jgi:phosphotransferase system enzyme I (PtsI)
MDRLVGISVFEGIAIGEPYLRKRKKLNIKVYRIEPEDVANEFKRLDEAVKYTKHEIKQLMDSLVGRVNQNELKILNVHLSMLEDPVFLSEINNKIKKELLNVEKVVEDVVNKYVGMFKSLDDPVYRQRAFDVQDVGSKIINNLLCSSKSISRLDNKILVCKELLPSELLKYHNENMNILGIITEFGGETSHVAILAKALGIPTIVGVKDIMKKEWKDRIILDARAECSCIIRNPNKKEVAHYEKQKKEWDDINKELESLKGKPIMTKDGQNFNLYANISGEIELLGIDEDAVDGVGLLRTEFLYMENQYFPSEQEQIEIYSKIYSRLGNDKPLTIRTLDIGADKKIPYYEMPDEENPFLGVRGMRFSLAHRDILEEQIRAILRVAAGKNIKMMYPMITNLGELDILKDIVEKVKNDMSQKGIEYKKDMEIGMMVEVPSTVFLADVFVEKVDFFSIGTNDLTQYILASDRLNEGVANIYDGYDPSVLRAINHVADVVIKHEKELSICGEMAGEAMAIVAFLSFGVKNLSMLPSLLLRARKIIRDIDTKELVNIKNEILRCKTAQEVRLCLGDYIRRIQ